MAFPNRQVRNVSPAMDMPDADEMAPAKKSPFPFKKKGAFPPKKKKKPVAGPAMSMMRMMQ